MLSKLLKYELKSTARVFLPLYVTLLIVATINGLFINSEIFNAQGLLMMIFGALLIALFVITVIVLIQRFSKNLLGDEGYLMFTLPVKSSSILISKYLVTILWTVLSGFVSVIAFLLIILISSCISGGINISEYMQILSEFMKTIFSSEYLSSATNIMLVIFISYSTFVFTVYLALSMGQLPIFNKHRNLASISSFIGINIIFSFIKNAIIMMLVKTHVENMQIYGLSGTIGNFRTFMNIILLIGLFFGTRFILDKKLNLE